MKQPNKTPLNEMPDKVRILIDYELFRKGQVIEKCGAFYEEPEHDFIWSYSAVDLLLQAGWAEPVEKKTKLDRVEYGKDFYIVNAEGKAGPYTNYEHTWVSEVHRFGNYFHTKEQAQRIIDSGELQAVFAKWQKMFAEEEAQDD